MLTDIEVNRIVNREVDYITSQWGHAEDRNHSVAANVLLINEYSDKARTAWVANAGDYRALQMVIKVAALCHVCLKQHGVDDKMVARP